MTQLHALEPTVPEQALDVLLSKTRLPLGLGRRKQDTITLNTLRHTRSLYRNLAVYPNTDVSTVYHEAAPLTRGALDIRPSIQYDFNNHTVYPA